MVDDMVYVLICFMVFTSLLLVADRGFDLVYRIPAVRGFFDRHFFHDDEVNTEEEDF